MIAPDRDDRAATGAESDRERLRFDDLNSTCGYGGEWTSHTVLFPLLSLMAINELSGFIVSTEVDKEVDGNLASRPLESGRYTSSE